MGFETVTSAWDFEAFGGGDGESSSDMTTLLLFILGEADDVLGGTVVVV